MLPYTEHEVGDVLRSPATDRSATDTSGAGSQTPIACKGLDHRAPFQSVTCLILSHILAVVTSKWMIHFILVCL
jgi:hypothetical protein